MQAEIGLRLSERFSCECYNIKFLVNFQRIIIAKLDNIR